jgi:hypothetical protein
VQKIKGGNIYDGKTDGKTYELKGKETHDGICQAKVPKNINILRNHSRFESYLYRKCKMLGTHNQLLGRNSSFFLLAN